MIDSTSAIGDSDAIRGGTIPGVVDSAAFRLWSAGAAELPVLIAVPHAGRSYPQALLDRMNNPGFAALRLEDRRVDAVAQAVARQTGASLLIADAPRAMIDLNRAPDDVDWGMFGEAPRAGEGESANHRARSGLGLIPRRLPGLGELWRQGHDLDELAERIAAIHAPYHAAIADMLAMICARWGAALLIDIHSMPPLAARAGQPAVELVIGDRFGASCHGGIVASAFAYLAEARVRVAHNRPYAGGYVLDRHGNPPGAVHAVQLEVDRRLYLDAALDQPGRGFERTVSHLSGLVRCMARSTAQLANAAQNSASQAEWAEAAE